MTTAVRHLQSVRGLTSLVAVIAWLVLPGKLEAQQPDSMKTINMQQQVDQMNTMMGPMMTNMAQAQITATISALGRPEIAQQLATFTKNYYDALVSRGFTKEEALRIVAGAGLVGLVIRH